MEARAEQAGPANPAPRNDPAPPAVEEMADRVPGGAERGDGAAAQEGGAASALAAVVLSGAASDARPGAAATNEAPAPLEETKVQAPNAARSWSEETDGRVCLHIGSESVLAVAADSAGRALFPASVVCTAICKLQDSDFADGGTKRNASMHSRSGMFRGDKGHFRFSALKNGRKQTIIRVVSADQANVMFSAVHPQPSTLNPQPSTPNPQFSTLNPETSTLNPQLPTLNPQPSTLYHLPSALNPQPSILNSQPSTLDPQPSTLNPQPSTLNLNPTPCTPNPEP